MTPLRERRMALAVTCAAEFTDGAMPPRVTP